MTQWHAGDYSRQSSLQQAMAEDHFKTREAFVAFARATFVEWT